MCGRRGEARGGVERRGERFNLLRLDVVCVSLKRYLLHRGTLVFCAVSDEYIKKRPMASRRPNGVSLVPFDSLDPPVSKKRIDFPERKWERAFPVPSSFLPLVFRGQPGDGAALADLQSPSTVLRCLRAALSATRQP